MNPHQDQYQLLPLCQTDLPEALDLCFRILNINQRFGTEKRFKKSVLNQFELTYSVKLMDGSKMIGLYLLNEKISIHQFLRLSPKQLQSIRTNPHSLPKNKKESLLHLAQTLMRYSGVGIQGIAVILLSQYRNKGLGRRLIEYPYTLSKQYNYIWGGHEFDLHNLFHWLKRRELLLEHNNTYYTIGSLKKSLKPIFY